MLDVQHPARMADGIFRRLDVEWSALCSDPTVQVAVAEWLVADRLADDVGAVTDWPMADRPADATGTVTDRVVADGVADAWTRTLGPAQVLAALRPADSRLSDELSDAVLRALLHRAAGHGRSATLAARVIVQAMIPSAVRISRSQVRGFGGRSFNDIGHLTVAVFLEVACSGKIHSRFGKPTSNLALDTLRHVCAELAVDREGRAEDLAAAEDLPDRAPGSVRTAEANKIRAAAIAAGLTPAGQSDEAETNSARLELLELVLGAMEAGALSLADGRAIAWYYTSTAVPDTEAAARTGITPGTWQRRRSRAPARPPFAPPFGMRLDYTSHHIAGRRRRARHPCPASAYPAGRCPGLPALRYPHLRPAAGLPRGRTPRGSCPSL
ncbi:hypothetical protein ACFQ9J_26070 [Streptomyces sp. NPDC056529]|uniref:hypothetical protein n=1 Tax=Streptomyces sp. NPDC056529 TaxID=3345855 RepID=UPI0036937AC1